MASKAKLRWVLKSRLHHYLGIKTITFDCSKSTLLFNIKRGRNIFRRTSDSPFTPVEVSPAYAYCINQDLIPENIFIMLDADNLNLNNSEISLTYLESRLMHNQHHLLPTGLQRPNFSLIERTELDDNQNRLTFTENDDNDHFDLFTRTLSAAIAPIVQYCWLTQASQQTVGQFVIELINHFSFLRDEVQSIPATISQEPNSIQDLVENIFCQHQLDEIEDFISTSSHTCHLGFCLLQWISDEFKLTSSFRPNDMLETFLECYVRHYIDYYYFSSATNRAKELCEDIVCNVYIDRTITIRGIIDSLIDIEASDPTESTIQLSIRKEIEIGPTTDLF